MLLADACTEYVFSCKVRRLSEKTIDNYRKQILYWNRYLDEVCDVQELEKVRAMENYSAGYKKYVESKKATSNKVEKAANGNDVASNAVQMPTSNVEEEKKPAA